MAAGRVFGSAAVLARAGLTTELLWATLALVCVILIGAAILVWIDRWRKRAPTDVLTPGDELSHFEALHHKGELSTEEFQKVRSLFNERLRKALDKNSAPAAAGPQAAASAEQRPAEPGPKPAPPPAQSNGEPPPGPPAAPAG
jgi:hypothetical protein